MTEQPVDGDRGHDGVRSVLLTQCVQRDFVDPIGRYDPLPNQLHVGHIEAVRLLGEDPSVGPLAQLMDWAQRVPSDSLEIVHIRDWHDPSDPAQHDHLTAFGEHCLRAPLGPDWCWTLTMSWRSGRTSTSSTRSPSTTSKAPTSNNY